MTAIFRSAALVSLVALCGAGPGCTSSPGGGGDGTGGDDGTAGTGGTGAGGRAGSTGTAGRGGSAGGTAGSSGTAGASGGSGGAAGTTGGGGSTGSGGTAGTGSGGSGGSGAAGAGGRGGSAGGGGAGGADAGADAGARPDASGGTDAGGDVPMALRPAGYACPDSAMWPSPMAEGQPMTVGSGGWGFTEGPVWIAAQKALYFSEISFGNLNTGGKIHKHTVADGKVAVFAPGIGTNGLAVDDKGMIVAAAHDMQTLARYNPATAARTAIAEAANHMGKPFNSPNDVVVRGDGHIYFTDPDYQRGNRPGQAEAVYHLPPGGPVKQIEARSKPNGISLSPDGRWLYVAGSQGGGVRRHPVRADGTVGAGTNFLGSSSDGMAVDCAGNLYLTSGGVVIYAPDGKMIRRVGGINEATNVAFGGDDAKTLFVTSGNGGRLHAVKMNLPGLPN